MKLTIHVFTFLISICLLGQTKGQVVTISSQDFETTPAAPTLTYGNTNGVISSGTNGGSGVPANANLFSGGTQGWQAVNTTSTVTFANQSLTGYTNNFIEFRLAGMSINAGNGIDIGDVVTISVSVDGGTTYSSELTINGSAANQRWDFTATGNITITYDGNNTPTANSSSTGSGGISTVRVNIPNVNNQVRLRIALLNNDANERWVIDDVRIRGEALVIGTSTLGNGALTEPTSFSALTTANTGAVSPQLNAVDNFDFTVTDAGDDATNMQISQIVFNQGTGNDISDWTIPLQGAQLSDGTNTLTGTINATNITFASIPTGAGQLGRIEDGANKTYTLKVWLKTNLGGEATIIDGKNFVFNISNASSFTITGSQIASGSVNSGASNNAVTVTSTALTFAQNTSNTDVNNNMSPSPAVSANDINGNRDRDFTASVSITSTGTLNSSPQSVAASLGLATFSIVHTATGTGFQLTASSSGFADITSSTFNINTISNATAILWSSAGGSAWLTGTNWTGSTVPTSSQVAQFGANPTAATVGVNMGNPTNNGANNQIIGAIEVTSARTSAALNVGNSAGSTSGTLTLAGVTINSISNTIIRNNSSQLLTIQANQSSAMGLAINNATNNIIQIDGSGGVTISSIISGGNPLTKQGSGNGVLTLSAANTYTGKTTINTGFIAADGENRFGTNPGGFVADQITLNGGGIQTSAGAINFNSNRGLTLGTSGGTFNTTGGFNITLTNVVTGSGSLTKTGTNTLILAGAHTYTGSTTISAGTLQLSTASERIANTSTLSIASGATFDLNGFSETVGSVTGAGNINSTATGNLTLTVGENNSSTTFNGIISNGTATSIAFQKNGSGSLELTGANTYTGLTTVSAGTLQLNRGADNTIPATNNVTINGGTLQISRNQTLNNLTLTSGNLTVDVGDVLTINGTLTISGGTITNNGTIAYGGSSTLVYNTADTRTASTEWPSSSPPTNITIQGGSVVTLPGNRTINTLTLTSGALTIGANTLTLDGAVTGSGTLSGSATSDLTIGGSPGTISFTSGTRTLRNLTIGTGGTTSLTLGSDLDITPLGGITFNAAGTKTLTTTGRVLTLKSTAAGTAFIGNTNGATITGNITAERFISSQGRRWRFLGSPFSNATFEDLRQEIYITGAGLGNTAGTLNSNGFDATLSNQPTVFSYTESVAGDLNQGWVALTNTTSSLTNQTIVAGKGYRVFVRGDRSDIGRLTGTVTSQNEVTANLTGVINTGNIIMPVTYTSNSIADNDGWNLLCNPYPSPYNWDAFYDSGTNRTNIDPTIWILDATTNSYKTFNATSSGTLTDGIIPAGASFWVKANAPLPSLTFTEQFKTTSAPIALYKSSEDALQLTFNLDSNTSDIFMVLHNPTALKTFDGFDVRKLNGTVNMMAVGSDSISLALDTRPLIVANDTINLFVSGGNATYQIRVASLPFTNGKTYYLRDKKTGTMHTLYDTTLVSYTSVQTDPTSFGYRFQLIISSNNALPVVFKSFNVSKLDETKALIEWTTAQEINNAYFEIERSIDGQKNWLPLEKIKGANRSYTERRYQFVDEQPSNDKINFYRLKQVDYDNLTNYSPVQTLSFIKAIHSFLKVHPNPVVHELKIESSIAIVKIELLNVSGKTELQTIGNSSIDLSELTSGVYILKLTLENGEFEVRKIVKQ